MAKIRPHLTRWLAGSLCNSLTLLQGLQHTDNLRKMEIWNMEGGQQVRLAHVSTDMTRRHFAAVRMTRCLGYY